MTINHLSPPADRLHAAAELLRQLVSDIARPTDRWRHHPELAVGPYVAHIACDGAEDWSGICDVILGNGAGPYIATMDPTVGLVIAGWLDLHAADLARTYSGEIGASDSPADTTMALAVADAILRIPAAKALAEQQQAVTG